MPRTYLRVMLLSCIVTLLLSALVNYAVDPYGLYRSVELAGVNTLKPKSGPNGQLVKPYRVLEARPRTLVLGNSRAEAGLDPESPAWPEDMRPVYNLSLPASGIDAALGNLRHVLASQPPKNVVLGIDFFDFVTDARRAGSAQAGEPGDLERRLLVDRNGQPNPSRQWQVIEDHATVLFSLNTLIDTVQTVAMQRMANVADLTAGGFYPMFEYRRFIQADGQNTMFRQVETTYLTSYLRLQPTLYPTAGNTSPELAQLAAIIAACRAANVRLIVFVHPYHAHILESYRAAGLWDLFEEWKRAVVRVVDEDRRAHPDQPAIALWDFSGFNAITIEDVPKAGDRKTQMQWYWEAGHYNAAVGDKVLAKILAEGDPADSAFGVRLTPDNVEAQIERIRTERERYAAAHAQDIEGIRTLAESIRNRTKPSR